MLTSLKIIEIIFRNTSVRLKVVYYADDKVRTFLYGRSSTILGLTYVLIRYSLAG
jgi:hypothetical protein